MSYEEKMHPNDMKRGRENFRMMMENPNLGGFAANMH
jgi:hypothetical protein